MTAYSHRHGNERHVLPDLRALLAEPRRSGDELRDSPLTPEMVAAVSKLMTNGDLVAAAAKVRVVTDFRTSSKPT